MAQKIIAANDLARMDPYRAVTHNKGILNGIDAVSLATGQDWRAIESSCHAFASGVGKSELHAYRALTLYSLVNDCLHGELTLPLCVGTKGGKTFLMTGIIQSNPLFTYTLNLLR